MPARRHPGSPGTGIGAAESRTALGDRLVLHRRLGTRRHLQQLRRRPGAPWPAYTELALYAQVKDDGSLELVNHLGIELGNDPEEILTRLQSGDYTPQQVRNEETAKASDARYGEHVRDVDADTPARFNADPSRLFEASGSAGKLCLFAVRLDTFPKEPSTVFYIGSNDPHDLTEVRRHLLARLPRLPIAGNTSTAPPSTSARNTARTPSW